MFDAKTDFYTAIQLNARFYFPQKKSLFWSFLHFNFKNDSVLFC
jgi:hypothetical protein